MTRKILIVLFGLALVVVCACERQAKNVAEKNPPSAPAYTTAENMAALSEDVTVAEVSLKGGGTIDGKALYVANCAACHQAAGTGVPSVFPPLVGSPYVTGPNVERLASIMLYGLMGEIKVNGITYNGVMLPLGHLKDEELSAIASYIRSSWGNSASPFEPAVFKKMREKWGTRAQFKIEELGVEP
jgi:mono/diheme cytochrome c family protein